MVYDGPNVVLDLDAATLEPISAYVHGSGIDQPIEWLRLESGVPEAPSRAVYHTDGLGSVVAMTRGGGEIGELVLRTYSYEAFGKVRVETEAPFAPVNRYTYTARESIGDSLGLMYYRWRVMDPNTGRFISEDPLRFVDGPNVYGYVRNNCALWSDPLGLRLPTPRDPSKPPPYQPPQWPDPGHPSWGKKFSDCWNDCWNTLNGGVPGAVTQGACTVAGTAAAAAGAVTAGELLAIWPVWGGGTAFGCSISCGVLASFGN
jgi:RHS repeat-associated protein